jgi:outer membrane protein
MHRFLLRIQQTWGFAPHPRLRSSSYGEARRSAYGAKAAGSVARRRPDAPLRSFALRRSLRASRALSRDAGAPCAPRPLDDAHNVNKILTRRRIAVQLAVVAAALSGLPPVARAQTPLFSQSSVAGQAPAGSTTEPVRRLSIEDAVRLALEQNLGIRVQRFEPQIQDVGVAQSRSFWAPSLVGNFSRNGQTQRSTSSLSGGATSVENGRFANGIGINQLLPWGGVYSANWNNNRDTTTSLFLNFSPQLQSAVNLNYSQPLLRDFSIDQVRQQVQLSSKLRDLSDVQLQAVIVQTTRNVKNAYWDLSYGINNLTAQRQSLELAERSLRDNQRRVEVGTMAPIDIIQAQAEVASNEQNVIIAEAEIKRNEDRLRALIFDPEMQDFWTTTIEPSDAAPFQEQAIDVDAAIRNALDKRSDLSQAKNSVAQSDINIRYYRNQSLPDIAANVNYIATGTGGTQLSPVDFSSITSGVIPARSIVANRSFGSALGDIFENSFPNWTVGVSISYPIGTSTADASLARARLQSQKTQTQIKNLQLQIATQVRDAARQVRTNQQRVRSARASRELQEKKLEAEEKKQAAGLSTSFFVFQAQRDLAQARTLEIRAIADYNKSLVNFEAVQLVPLTPPGAGGGPTDGTTSDGTTSGSSVQTAGGVIISQ